MCGKFTAMGSWRKVWDFSQPLMKRAEDGSGEAPDEVVTYGVGGPLPVIVWDAEAGTRRVVPMRWGFPHPRNPRVIQPIHARSETVDSKDAFADVFHLGQRGIVVMRTFNEGKELSATKTEQWTIDPGDGISRGFAFVWRRFEMEGQPAPMLACVMVTVPASALVRTIMEGNPDPRMPAIIEDADWSAWLGEVPTSPAEAKAVLRTMEGVNWKIAKEPPKPKAPPKPKREKPTPEPELF
jgi:putative SOS response-associated peptidase YedK